MAGVKFGRRSTIRKNDITSSIVRPTYLDLLRLGIRSLLDLILSLLGEANAEKTERVCVARFH